MALTRSQMNLVASGGAGKVWTYFTTDAVATVQAANYFLPMFLRPRARRPHPCRAVVGGTEVHFDASVLVTNSTGNHVTERLLHLTPARACFG